MQALSEGEKAAGNIRDISKSRYARKLKKKAKMQGKKGTKTAKSAAREPTAAQDAGASGTGEGLSLIHIWADNTKTESKTAQAQMLILELLADGKRMPSAELEKTVNERGISSRTCLLYTSRCV